MRVAIYLEDGVSQIVLTPESAWETTALKSLTDGAHQLRASKGGFYECQGGWFRQDGHDTTDSVILRLDKVPPVITAPNEVPV